MANNVNNGITGVIDIPGALRSRGAADGNLVGGVVAYAGDIYDVTAGKNQATLNAEFAEGITNLLSNSSGISDVLTKTSVGGAYTTVVTSGIAKIDLSSISSLQQTVSNILLSAVIPDDNRGVVLAAVNNGVRATGDQAVAYGYSTSAQGDYSIAGGNGTWAYGDKSVAFGTDTFAWGVNTIAAGNGSVAFGTESVALGENTYTRGKASGYFGKGRSVSAYVIDSGAGSANSDPWYTLSLDSSFGSIVGYPDGRGVEDFRVLPGMYIAPYGTEDYPQQPGWLIKNVEYIHENLDWTCKVYIDDPNDDAPSDPYMLAVRCTVSEGYSYALGRYLFTTNQSEVAVGDYNVSHKAGGSAASGSGTIFSVGTGILSDTSEYLVGEDPAIAADYLFNQTYRANALEVLTNGSVYVRGVGGYDGRSLSGATDLATTLTNINTALANASGGGISQTTNAGTNLTTDSNSSASGAQSVTYGDDCIASGDQSFAGGTESIARGENSVALGNAVSAFDSGSFAGGTTNRMHVQLVSETTQNSIHYITLTCVSNNVYLCSEAMYLCDYTTLEPYIRSRAVTVSGNTITLEVDGYNFTETELPSGKNSANTDFWLCTGGCGNNSFSYGDNLVTTNPGEAAFGRKNISRTGDPEDGADDTLFSVGIGSTDRENAVEILTGGSVYVTGIGGYDGQEIGSNTKSLQDVIAELTLQIAALTNNL